MPSLQHHQHYTTCIITIMHHDMIHNIFYNLIQRYLILRNYEHDVTWQF
jgi:hypothetical protein